MTTSTQLRTGIVDQVRARINAIGWAEVARRSGIDRTQLYRNFSPSAGHANPRLTILLAVAPAVGFELTLTGRPVL